MAPPTLSILATWLKGSLKGMIAIGILARRGRWTTWALWLLGMLAALGLSSALAVGAAVLVHPPLFAELRPWWPPLAAVGLISTAAGYWLLWGRER